MPNRKVNKKYVATYQVSIKEVAQHTGSTFFNALLKQKVIAFIDNT